MVAELGAVHIASVLECLETFVSLLEALLDVPEFREHGLAEAFVVADESVQILGLVAARHLLCLLCECFHLLEGTSSIGVAEDLAPVVVVADGGVEGAILFLELDGEEAWGEAVDCLPEYGVLVGVSADDAGGFPALIDAAPPLSDHSIRFSVRHRQEPLGWRHTSD